MEISVKKILTIKEVQDLTTLSRATINRKRAINDFPAAVNLGGNRIGFIQAEIDEWLECLPRIIAPEVNDNRPPVRCPSTPEELQEADYQDYIKLKLQKQGEV